MAEIKRIFLAGAPGSMWSGIDKWIRMFHFPNVDNTDITPQRRWHGHEGVYWNPGNEPGYDWILNFDKYSKEEILQTLDSVYDPIPEDKDFIIRTHKSHHFSYHIDKIVELFPDADILLVHQEPHKSYLWWEISGGHDTVYDPYHYYNRDYEAIWKEIVDQTKCIECALEKYNLTLETPNERWFKKHYGEPSELFSYRMAELKAHPDKIDTLVGYSAKGRGLANTSKIAIIKGNPRKF
jgi:hypothetical protein